LHLQDHLNKKFPCDRLLPNLTQNCTQNTEEIPNLTQNCTQNNTKNNTKKITTISKSDVIDSLNNNECYYCHKVFSRKYCVERHLKLFCKVVKENNKKLQTIYDELQNLKTENKEIKKINNDMQKEMSEIKSQLIINQKSVCGDVINSNNIINNNTLNNNSINITIIGCGKEDMNRINR
jgi:hypothetical protein